MASAAGMTLPLAGVKTDSATSSVQASKAPPTEMIKPMLISSPPHDPVTASSTPAIEGDFQRCQFRLLGYA